jgi:hypothetical protein
MSVAVKHYEKELILSSNLEVSLHGGFHNILSHSISHRPAAGAAWAHCN